MLEKENIQALEEAFAAYLQPALDQYFSLETWAGIWAEENRVRSGNALAKFQEHLSVIDRISASLEGLSGRSKWDAICEFWITISLNGHDFNFSVIVNEGNIDHIELLLDDVSDEALKLDLAYEFDKKLTWLAISN